MAKNIIRILFTLANVAHFSYIIYFISCLKIPGHRHNAMGGQWKFLTYWNIWLQLIYFSVALMNEVFGARKESASKILKVRDFLFGTMAFPLGTFVTVSFWLLYSIDRNFVFPPKMDEFYPVWANHMCHTTCMISQFIEMTTSSHVYPSRKKGILTSVCFALVYLGWVLVIAFKANIWIYGILQKLPTIGRAIFLGGSSLIFGSLYLFGEFLNNRKWSSPQPVKLVQEVTENGNDEPLPTHSYNTRSRRKVAKAD